MAQIQQEISILKCIQHPNIVQIKDVVQTDQQVYIFLSRVLGGGISIFI